MTTELEVKQDLISALQDTAMLCGLRTRALGLQRTHKTASVQVTADNNAATNAASVRVNRLAGADSYHRQIVSLQTTMRRLYEANTLPWDGAGGWRLLPNTSFLRVAGLMQPIQKQIKTCLEEYAAKATDIIEQARVNLGSLADEIALPTVEELVDAYETKLEFGTISDTKALKNLPASLADKLATHMQNRAQVAYTDAMEDIKKRMVKPLRHLIERLYAYDDRESRDKVEGERDLQGVFRDTTVMNITELAVSLPTLTALADEESKKYVYNFVELSNSISAESLRASRAARDNARAKAASLLSDMGF